MNAVFRMDTLVLFFVAAHAVLMCHVIRILVLRCASQKMKFLKFLIRELE